MNQPELRSLAGVPLEVVHAAFLAAFADYAVPMQLDLAALATMLTRRGYAPELSVGAFAGEQLVAFHLICRGSWQGRPAVYDTGSGVLPTWRGRRLSRAMFEWLAPRWRDAGVVEARLEVLVDNLAARRSYESVGFTVCREFDCLQLDAVPEAVLAEGVSLRVETSNHWPEVARAWFHVEPAWQNSIAALAASPQVFSRLALWRGEVCVAVGIINPVSGELPLFAVAPDQRRQGLGRALLAALRAHSEKPLRFINLESGCDSVLLLQALGAQCTARQVEMVWPLA
ncbi:GNAT family N-acetyltransferase [Chitinimonas sp.]|uniref:GNAT family N-acetyltransferase n=1 Tax=Chitinimonas sp. TaxID=1934313 RepID=UPI002F9288B1